MMYVSRAALQVVLNDESENQKRISTTLHTFCKKNKISLSCIHAIIFSQTEDVDFLNPATSIRSFLPAKHIALFCSQEPEYPNSKPYTVRMLIFFSHLFPWKKVKSVYLYGAEDLRSDLKL